jgi:hypothetical protein
VLEPSSIDEGVDVGTVVGELVSVADPARLDFALAAGEGDTHNHLFELDGTMLVTAAPLDYEAMGSELGIRVTATNPETGEVVEETLIVMLRDLGEISLIPSEIAENVEPGTYIGSFAVSGTEEGAAFAFTLVPGDGDSHNDLFTIAGADLVTAAELDFEELGPSLSIRVAATDLASGEVVHEHRLFVVLNDFEAELTAAEAEILGALKPVCDPQGDDFVLWYFPQLDPNTRVPYTFGDDRAGGERRHRGADLMGAEKGAPVVAVADGVVSYVGTGENAGFFVIVHHSDGWQTRYMHLNNDTPGTDDGLLTREEALAPGITVGAEVVGGQLIGWVGDSGNAENSPPHTHFELWQSNHLADPFGCLHQAWGWQSALWNLGVEIL